MALKKMVERFTRPVEELDREQLTAYCDARQLAAMDTIAPRTRVKVGGEVRSVRIVPRAGAPALEVTVSDGRGSIVGVFLGRRKIAGLSPGRKVAFEGVSARDGKRYLLFNPIYELLTCTGRLRPAPASASAPGWFLSRRAAAALSAWRQARR